MGCRFVNYHPLCSAHVARLIVGGILGYKNTNLHTCTLGFCNCIFSYYIGPTALDQDIAWSTDSFMYVFNQETPLWAVRCCFPRVFWSMEDTLYLLGCSCLCRRAGQETVSQSWEWGGWCRCAWSRGWAGQTPPSLWRCWRGVRCDPGWHSGCAEVLTPGSLQASWLRAAAGRKLLQHARCCSTAEQHTDSI